MYINSIKEIISEFDSFLKDLSKFEVRENKAAGKRVRKFLLKFAKLAKLGRKEVLEAIRKIPKKRK